MRPKIETSKLKKNTGPRFVNDKYKKHGPCYFKTIQFI